MAATIAIVGAGRVGRALGRRLHELGWPIGAVVTRSLATARAAVRAIGDGRAYGGLTRNVLAADVVLLATQDAAIREVAARLARMGGEEWHSKTVLHTSGALDRTALAPLEHCGAATGSLHPLQTFSGRSVPELDGYVFAIEGTPAALRMARRICRELGGVPARLEGRGKPAYHAAGALVAGHLLAIVEAATRLLMSLGFTRRQATRALLPLARQTLTNFEQLGPRTSWTGPVARGDFETVARHVVALRQFPHEYRAAYRALACLGAALLARQPRVMLRRLERVLRKGRAGQDALSARR